DVVASRAVVGREGAVAVPGAGDGVDSAGPRAAAALDGDRAAGSRRAPGDRAVDHDVADRLDTVIEQDVLLQRGEARVGAIGRVEILGADARRERTGCAAASRRPYRKSVVSG